MLESISNIDTKTKNEHLIENRYEIENQYDIAPLINYAEWKFF